jgi:hypothetical protein
VVRCRIEQHTCQACTAHASLARLATNSIARHGDLAAATASTSRPFCNLVAKTASPHVNTRRRRRPSPLPTLLRTQSLLLSPRPHAPDPRPSLHRCHAVCDDVHCDRDPYQAMTTPEQKRLSSGSRVLGVTGPTGEPGLPPSRPSSIGTAHSGSQKRWSRTEALRTGGGLQSGISVSGSLGPQSRPTTAASRTHVPLAAHGFFRPMSSQRLQQQRNQRPNSLLANGSLYSEGTHDAPASSYRQSIGSTQTMRGGPNLGLHHELDQPPPSRGTDITDRDMPDRTTANTTPTGAETVRSRGESITPLQRPRPQHLDLANVHRNDAGKLPTPSKSPRSFRSSFLLSSRDGRTTQMRPNQGHEKLTSAESSPRLARKEVSKAVVRKELGKNHEYFSGNTAFCWGGRLQNTRDRPVNIATAILIILPAALFFGYSCVRPPLHPYNWSNHRYLVRPGCGSTFPHRYPFSLRTFSSYLFLPSFMLQLRIRA